MLIRRTVTAAAREFRLTPSLNDRNSAAVLEAFDRMSAANKAQHEGWDIIEHAEP